MSVPDSSAAAPGSASASVACWACGLAIDPTDRYCRGCGKGQGAHIHWYYRHWGIILMTLGLGPFGLFFAWRSPVISRTAKGVYTAVVGLVTVWFCVSAYRAWQLAQTLVQVYLQGGHFQQ